MYMNVYLYVFRSIACVQTYIYIYIPHSAVCSVFGSPEALKLNPDARDSELCIAPDKSGSECRT